MDISKQKYLLEILLSSNEVFSRCSPIVKPEYFDGDLRLVTKFIIDYFNDYRSVPDLDTVAAEFEDVGLTSTIVTRDKMEYACKRIEKYCQDTSR